MHRDEDLPNPYSVDAPEHSSATLHYLVAGAMTAGAVAGGGLVVTGPAGAATTVEGPAIVGDPVAEDRAGEDDGIADDTGATVAGESTAGPVTAAEAHRWVRIFVARLDTGSGTASPALSTGPVAEAVLETYRPGSRAVVEFLQSVADLAVTLDAGGPASPALTPGSPPATGRELLEWGMGAAGRMLDDLHSAAAAVVGVPPTGVPVLHDVSRDGAAGPT